MSVCVCVQRSCQDFLPTIVKTSLNIMTSSNVDVDIFGSNIIKLPYLFPTCIRVRCMYISTSR